MLNNAVSKMTRIIYMSWSTLKGSSEKSLVPWTKAHRHNCFHFYKWTMAFCLLTSPWAYAARLVFFFQISSFININVGRREFQWILKGSMEPEKGKNFWGFPRICTEFSRYFICIEINFRKHIFKFIELPKLNLVRQILVLLIKYYNLYHPFQMFQVLNKAIWCNLI